LKDYIVKKIKNNENLTQISETKAEKFERIAQRRVTEIIAKTRLIGNLSDRRNYEYTEEQVRQIFDALDAEVRACKIKFKSGDVATPVVFSFKR
jgi:hypothetical protein